MTTATYDVKPFSRARHDIVDSLEVGVRRHMVHALLELDVTHARALLREHEARTGEKLSFTAFLVASLGRASTATSGCTRSATGAGGWCCSTRWTS